jgi:GT2 family glycosyltransferase
MEKISVVITTKDRPAYLASALSSLLAQTLTSFDLHILLNGHSSWSDQCEKITYALRHRQVDCFVYHQPSLTFAQAHEFLMSHSVNPLLCRVDDDHILSATYLSSLHAVMAANADCAAVGGIVLHPEASSVSFSDESFRAELLASVERGFLNTRFQLLQHPSDRPLFVTDLYSSFLLRKTAALDAGGIATCYEACSYREETDLTLRMFLAGYRLAVAPSAIIWHVRCDFGGERTSAENWKGLVKVNEELFKARLASWNIGREIFRSHWLEQIARYERTDIHPDRQN